MRTIIACMHKVWNPVVFKITGFLINGPFLTKILPPAEGSQHKSEQREQKYATSCNSTSSITHCYDTFCLVQTLDKMYRRKEPEKLGAIPIDWFKSVLQITGCANCFPHNSFWH